MTSYYKDKKVVVIGLARSGIAAVNLLQEAGAKVFVTDSSSNDKLKELARGLTRDGIKVELGAHTLDFIRDKDLVVVSPGGKRYITGDNLGSGVQHPYYQRDRAGLAINASGRSCCHNRNQRQDYRNFAHS